jgi:hypothetical protein
MESMDWQALLSSVVGGGGVMAIAKYFLASSAAKLEEIPKDIALIKMELAKIEIHVSEIARLKETVREHDRILSILSAQNPRMRSDALDHFNGLKTS